MRADYSSTEVDAASRLSFWWSVATWSIANAPAPPKPLGRRPGTPLHPFAASAVQPAMTDPIFHGPHDPALELRSRLEAVADPVRAAGEAKYLKLERRRVIGTSMPGAERVLTGFVQDFGLPSDPPLLARLFDASLEEAWCAIWMLAAQPAFTIESWRLTEMWSGAPDTWALADPISLLLVAGHLDAGVIGEDVLRDWAAREEPFWYRRIALVATVSLNDGLHGPTQRRLRRIGRVPPIGESPRPQLTFDLLEASIHDRRHFIRLGIGWALRPLSAVDPDGVAAFVQRHRAQITKAMLRKARLDDDGRRAV